MTPGEEKGRRTLELRLLGSPEVWLAGQMITGFRSGKARALLYFLAVTGRAQPRSVLAGLFWGDVAESQARRSLTMTLSNLRQLVGPYLLINRETIAIDPDSAYWLDVAAFDAGLAADPNAAPLTPLQQAIDLYRGDFLEDVSLAGAESAQLNRGLIEAGVEVSSLAPRRRSLEDLFAELTAEPAAVGAEEEGA